MTTTETSRAKAKKKKEAEDEEKEERRDRTPVPSATPDRGEEASLEKQASPPVFSPALQRGNDQVGPAVSVSAVGSTEGVVEATIPDGPAADDD